MQKKMAKTTPPLRVDHYLLMHPISSSLIQRSLRGLCFVVEEDQERLSFSPQLPVFSIDSRLWYIQPTERPHLAATADTLRIIPRRKPDPALITHTQTSTRPHQHRSGHGLTNHALRARRSHTLGSGGPVSAHGLWVGVAAGEDEGFEVKFLFRLCVLLMAWGVGGEEQCGAGAVVQASVL